MVVLLGKGKKGKEDDRDKATDRLYKDRLKNKREAVFVKSPFLHYVKFFSVKFEAGQDLKQQLTTV